MSTVQLLDVDTAYCILRLHCRLYNTNYSECKGTGEGEASGCLQRLECRTAKFLYLTSTMIIKPISTILNFVTVIADKTRIMNIDLSGDAT